MACQMPGSACTTDPLSPWQARLSRSPWPVVVDRGSHTTPHVLSLERASSAPRSFPLHPERVGKPMSSSSGWGWKWGGVGLAPMLRGQVKHKSAECGGGGMKRRWERRPVSSDHLVRTLATRGKEGGLGLTTAVLLLERGEASDRPAISRRVGRHRSASDSDSSGERDEGKSSPGLTSHDKNWASRSKDKGFFQPQAPPPLPPGRLDCGASRAQEARGRRTRARGWWSGAAFRAPGTRAPSGSGERSL